MKVYLFLAFATVCLGCVGLDVLNARLSCLPFFNFKELSETRCPSQTTLNHIYAPASQTTKLITLPH